MFKKTHTAFLSSKDGYTVFTFGKTCIRFLAPYSLEKYIDVVQWDNGYLVVNAKYTHSKEIIEEYIDISYILNNLYMDEKRFLRPIKEVKVLYDNDKDI